MAHFAAVEGRVDLDFSSNTVTALEKLVPTPRETFETELSKLSEPTWNIPLNIVVQVVGSRGDVQPFIAMGTELQRFGHRIRIATHTLFEDFVKSAGLEFFSIGGDPADLMSYMVRNPGLIPSIKTLKEGEIQTKRRMMKTILEGCWKSCITPDPATGRPFVANAIIANPPAFAHVHCAQALGIPLHLVFTMPWTITSEFPHPLANIQTPTSNLKTVNYISYGLVQSLTWQGLGDVINEWRYTMDLERVPLSEGPFLAETLKTPTTYCWSPALVPKPKDWPSHVDVCGFLFRDPPQYSPPPDLAAFLASGPPPIYIGFGSIVIDNPEDTVRMLLDAIKSCNVRAIISKGWSKLGGSNSNTAGVFYLDDCPHEWLFQHVSAVVHHGGAGTTACGLRHGRPTIIVPFFGDQPFWGNMVAAATAGPEPIPFKLLNTQTLARAICFCLQPQVTDAAAKLSTAIKEECGVKAAIASFHRNLQAEKLVCDILPDLPAFWTCKGGGRSLKLSGLAAEILMQRDKLKSKDLKLYRPKPFIIENRRWDPASAAASSVMGVPVDLLNATSEIWKGPMRLRDQETEPDKLMPVSAKQVGEMTGASLMSIPYIFGSIMKGFVIDLPLAMTEGLRATPRLYGQETMDHEPIVDWSSGVAVARKEIIDAFTTKPIGKGLGRCVLAKVTKTSSAGIGLLAYPAQGLYKTAYTAVHSKAKKGVVNARTVEQQYILQFQGDGVDHEQVVVAFDQLYRLL